MADANEADAREGQSLPLAVSNAIVHLYKEQLGRGPTRARTHFAGPDTLVTTLEDTLAPAERALVELGEIQRMTETRLMLMRAAEPKFRETIEQVTGRKVRAIVCGLAAKEDISTKVFYLQPGEGSAATPR
jgi:uncharacterized protein YbcI